MKKVFVVLLCLMLVGCGSSGGSSSNVSESEEPETVTETEEKVYISEDEIEDAFSDPDKYSGKYVVLTGKIFTDPEYSDDIICLQIFNDVKNSSNGFVVYANRDGCDVDNGDYVVVDGQIQGTITGENMLGQTIERMQVNALSVEKSSYIDVVSPTIVKYSPNTTREQYGYSVTVTDLEFAEDETRVYITVKNDGSDKFYVYSTSMKLIQDSKQYETEYNFDADYPELQSELLPGTESSGIISFPAIEQNVDFKFYCEGYSDNYDEDIQPFEISFTFDEQ